MRTIILSTKMPPGIGGRPMHLGHLVWEEGISGFGLFIGYDKEGHRIGVKSEDLEKCFSSIGMNYKIKVSLERDKHLFGPIQLALKFLIPKRVKQEILKQNI